MYMYANDVDLLAACSTWVNYKWKKNLQLLYFMDNSILLLVSSFKQDATHDIQEFVWHGIILCSIHTTELL